MMKNKSLPNIIFTKLIIFIAVFASFSGYGASISAAGSGAPGEYEKDVIMVPKSVIKEYYGDVLDARYQYRTDEVDREIMVDGVKYDAYLEFLTQAPYEDGKAREYIKDGPSLNEILNQFIDESIPCFKMMPLYPSQSIRWQHHIIWDLEDQSRFPTGFKRAKVHYYQLNSMEGINPACEEAMERGETYKWNPPGFLTSLELKLYPDGWKTKIC